jgi:hypothetical protein
VKGPINKIKGWVDFYIKNQQELKTEHDASIPFPEWNKGYMEALKDMRAEISRIVSFIDSGKKK